MTNFDPQEAERLADALRYKGGMAVIEYNSATVEKLLRAAVERVRELEAEIQRLLPGCRCEGVCVCP